MSMMKTLLAAAAVAFALPAFANDGMMVSDPYARVSAMMSKSGAIFMTIENHTGSDDRLIAATSDVAERVELHTHKEDANGVMQMLKVEEGFPIAAGETHALARGGDHVMLLGLTRELKQGDVVKLSLTFEKAGELALEVPVDLNRKEGGMGMMKHKMGNCAEGAEPMGDCPAAEGN